MSSRITAFFIVIALSGCEILNILQNCTISSTLAQICNLSATKQAAKSDLNNES